MLSLSHTLISLPFGIYLQNPGLIFLAAFIFHVFCDTLVHWNIYPARFRHYPYGLIALDIISGLVLAAAITGDHFLTLPILLAIAGGNAPDILHNLWDFLPRAKKHAAPAWLQSWFVFHHRAQLETYNKIAGLISQVLLITISIWLTR